ncbi:MAG: isoprenoid biosynthesis glyoxalase ElbB [Bdellovibrionota bacterium]
MAAISKSTPKKIAVVLSGCGFLDGSEITEAVSTLISLSELGVETTCFAPNDEVSVVDHANHSPAGRRNMLSEANRIARGEAKDLTTLQENEFDAVVFPGGFGAAKNLSNWAEAGVKSKVHPEVSRVIKAFHDAVKPIGAICIAPTLVAKVLGKNGVTVTIGNDAATAAEIEKTGAVHVQCAVTDYVSDRDHKVLTTPAYMYEAQPYEVFTGIRRMLRELVEMA